MLKYIGLVLITVSAVWVSGEYSMAQKRRLSELLGFVDFTAHMRIGIGCFMYKGSELAQGFECEALERVGFLEALRGGMTLSDAFDSCKKRLSLGLREREALDELFSCVGRGYLSDGVRITDKTLSMLEKIKDRLRIDVPKNIKLFTTLAAALSVGVIILVA